MNMNNSAETEFRVCNYKVPEIKLLQNRWLRTTVLCYFVEENGIAAEFKILWARVMCQNKKYKYLQRVG